MRTDAQAGQRVALIDATPPTAGTSAMPSVRDVAYLLAQNILTNDDTNAFGPASGTAPLPTGGYPHLPTPPLQWACACARMSRWEAVGGSYGRRHLPVLPANCLALSMASPAADGRH